MTFHVNGFHGNNQHEISWSLFTEKKEKKKKKKFKFYPLILKFCILRAKWCI